MIEGMTGFLFHFGKSTICSKEHLINKFSEELFNAALNSGFIKMYGKNSDGIDTYIITTIGIEYRDRR